MNVSCSEKQSMLPSNIDRVIFILYEGEIGDWTNHFTKEDNEFFDSIMKEWSIAEKIKFTFYWMTTVTLWFIFYYDFCKAKKYPVVTSLADRNAKYYHQKKNWIHLKKSHSWCSMFIKCIHIPYLIKKAKEHYQSMYHCISHCLGTLRKLKLSSHIQRKQLSRQK